VRILILGGTRFLGRRVAEVLASSGHDLTLLSRRRSGVPAGVHLICAERDAGLANLKLLGSRFDLVLDFICYEKKDLVQLTGGLVEEHYVLISSTWLPRLWSGSRADELPSSLEPDSAGLPRVTLKYLNGKLRAEQALAHLRQTGCKAVSLRLPIMLGADDHTGRTDFYLSRMADGKPLIAVDGGHNYAQIAAMEDIAQAIVPWATNTDISRFPVWEALPDDGQSVRSIIERMATAAGVAVRLADVPSAELANKLPDYLEQEPFWRESALPLTKANIFDTVGLKASIFEKLLNLKPRICKITKKMRCKEIQFLENRKTRE